MISRQKSKESGSGEILSPHARGCIKLKLKLATKENIKRVLSCQIRTKEIFSWLEILYMCVTIIMYIYIFANSRIYTCAREAGKELHKRGKEDKTRRKTKMQRDTPRRGRRSVYFITLFSRIFGFREKFAYDAGLGKG